MHFRLTIPLKFLDVKIVSFCGILVGQFNKIIIFDSVFLDNHHICQYFIFSENSFRCGIHAVVTFPLFDVFIMLVIVASSISLAAEVIIIIGFDLYKIQHQDPINVDGEWNKFLGQLDYGFTFIFAIEVLLKVWKSFGILKEKLNI